MNSRTLNSNKSSDSSPDNQDNQRFPHVIDATRTVPEEEYHPGLFKDNTGLMATLHKYDLHSENKIIQCKMCLIKDSKFKAS